MALQCPAGHASTSDDYCDVCGMPIQRSAASPSAPAPTAPPPPAPEPRVCPNCSVQNLAEALFCEACGYDFTTGTLPRPAAGILDLDAPLPDSAPTASAESAAPQEGPASLTSPVSAASAPPSGPVGGASQAQQQDLTAGQDPTQAWSPMPTQPASPAAEPGPAVSASASPAPQPEPPAEPRYSAGLPADTEFEWVAELWIDPEWYALQQSPDPLPSPGLPTVIPLRGPTFLIGRKSRSRQINPDLDCGDDTGISRRQSELTTDGRRWFIQDLGSANGTFVAAAASPLPTQPIPAGRRHELAPDDRIFVGAWTRIVLRKATADEVGLYS